MIFKVSLVVAAAIPMWFDAIAGVVSWVIIFTVASSST